MASAGREGDGHLQVAVRRGQPDDSGLAVLHVEVEVSSFYPMIASRFSRFVYTNTQSRIHVIVTHGFLRSLTRLDLAESRVGRFCRRPRRRRRGVYPYSRPPVTSRSLRRSWRAWMRRTVPDRERMTMDSVVAWSPRPS